jgi:hypothetical protein
MISLQVLSIIVPAMDWRAESCTKIALNICHHIW